MKKTLIKNDDGIRQSGNSSKIKIVATRIYERGGIKMILNVPLNFDEKAIEAKIEGLAEQEMKDYITKLVNDTMKHYDRSTWSGTISGGVEAMVRDVIREDLKEYRDEIIEKAVGALVDGAKKTKKFKEAKKTVKENYEEDQNG